MKTYQKAELIAKNLPTGSYAAGCPSHHHPYPGMTSLPDGRGIGGAEGCMACEIAQ